MDTYDQETLNWLIGWVLLMGLLAIVVQSKSGYSLVYYALALMVVFLFVTQYQFISKSFAAVTGTAPDAGKSGSGSGNTSATTVRTLTDMKGSFGAGGIIINL